MFQDCRYWQAQRINLLNKWIQKFRVCSTSRENSFQEACAFSVNLSAHMRLVWGMSWELVYHSPPQLPPKPKAQSPEWQWAHVPMSSAEEDHRLRSSVGLDTQRKKERKRSHSVGCIRLFATPWTVAHQAPLSMGFSRQDYWSGLRFHSPGDLPDPGIEPGSPALRADALPSDPPGKPKKHGNPSAKEHPNVSLLTALDLPVTWWPHTISAIDVVISVKWLVFKRCSP